MTGNRRLMTEDWGLGTDYRLPTTDYLSLITDHWLPAPGY